MNNDMITIERPRPPAVVAELAPVVQAAREFVVRDVETDRMAMQRFRACRVGRKQIEEHFKKAIEDAHRAHKSLLASVTALTGPIQEAERLYDAKSQAYQREQRRIAEEETRRIQERARREEEDRLLDEAVAAEASGDADGAAAILDQPVTAPAIVVAPAVAEVEGVSTRELWGAECHDVKAALKYLGEGPYPAAALARFVPLVETFFRPQAIAQRQALNVPGVRAVSRESRAAR